MKFYVYRREDSVDLPFDFSVRRVSSEASAFEFCDVLEPGVAYGAGIRTGDRPSGVMGADTLTSKNPHNWCEQSLETLNEAEAGKLFVLFVDKRVPLSRREELHMKKRAEFISARKSNLKRLGRLDELAKFVIKWDNKNVVQMKEVQARAEKEVRVKKEVQVRPKREKAPQSTRSRSGPQIIRMCVYDAEFSVRKVQEDRYEIYGVEEGSVAYQVGIRDGDFACGFKHYNEDGRSKSHAWCDNTLGELKKIGVFFIDILKSPPFGKAALRDCMKREKYVSKIKSRLGGAIEAEEFLVRVRSWDHFQVKSIVKDARSLDILESRVEDVTVEQHQRHDIVAGRVAEPENDDNVVATSLVHLENEDEDNPSLLQPERSSNISGDNGVELPSAENLERTTRTLEVDTSMHVEGIIAMPVSPHSGNSLQPHFATAEQHTQETETMPAPEVLSPAAKLHPHFDHDHDHVLTEKRETVKVYPRSPASTEPTMSKSPRSSEAPSYRKRSETKLDAREDDLPVDGFTVDVWNGVNSERGGCFYNRNDDNSGMQDEGVVVSSAEVNVRAPQSASAQSSLGKRSNAEHESEGSSVSWKIRKHTETCVNENVPRNGDINNFDGSNAEKNLQEVDQVEAPECKSADRASASDAAKKLLIAVASKPRLKRLIKFPNWERRVLEVLNRPTEDKTITQLDATIGLLCKARVKPDSSETVDVCVDWVVKTLECLPLRDGYSLSMSIPVDTVQYSVVQVKDKMAEAKKGSGSARQEMLAWKAATDCIVEAMSAFKQCVLHQQQQSCEWKRWLESINDHVFAQRVEISRIVEESKGMMASFEAAAAAAKQKMADYERALHTEIDKAEAKIAGRHRAHAIAGDFDNCARYRYTHVKALSADQNIASLYEGLTKYSKKVRVGEKKAASTKESMAFWQSLEVLCDIVQCEHATQMKLALSKLDASTEAFQRQVQQGLSWTGEVLIDALEHYFNHSFRVQENALDRVEKLRLEKEEHDAKFGGYFAFDDSAKEVYKQVVIQSKAEDREVIQSQLNMWRDLMQNMPEFGSLFAFGALDQKLSEAHEHLWAEIKKPLQKAFDGLLNRGNRGGSEASQVLPCEQQLSSEEECGISLAVQTSLPRSETSAVDMEASESKTNKVELGESVQEGEGHTGMTPFVVDDSVARAAFNDVSENGCNIT